MNYEAIADKNRKFTNAEFKSLDRNADGDIIDLSECFFLISPSQVEQLSCDDWSRIQDYEEELRCLMADAHVEFGF
jgi:hypothetical protein